MEKRRYIALTDINPGIEIDDIQSMLRLLLYSNEIDIEGLIACTSCFVMKTKRETNLKLILDIIDGYEKVLPNLKVHACGWPSAEKLRSCAAFGIPVFGWKHGIGFANKRWNDNEGVRLILSAMKNEDDRPLWIGLWGGANTLAQAIWMAEKQLDPESFDSMLKKLRIYAISDQDFAGKWLRKKYGDRLFYIVTPSGGSFLGSRDYYKATWPGISADRNDHGSEDGVNKTKGFTGADYSCIDSEWIRRNIQSVGEYGKQYPDTVFIAEGDTPSYLGIIPNGLNDPEHPDHGGWGGRYALGRPDKEPYPIWTNTPDTVKGLDGKDHTSPQATIWRWRTAFQNDFASRIQWTIKDEYRDAVHPLQLSSPQTVFEAKSGDKIDISVNIKDTDGNGYDISWIPYPEAGCWSFDTEISLPEKSSDKGGSVLFSYTVPDGSGELHLILQASTRTEMPVTRYIRFVFNITDKQNGGTT